MMHRFAADLKVALEPDRPGLLAKATDAVGRAGINIDGYAQIGGSLHLLTPDPTAARRALEAAGLAVTSEQQVLVIDVEDRPTVAAEVFRRIASGEVNVHFTYVATNNRLVVGADNLAKVAKLLSRPSTAS